MYKVAEEFATIQTILDRRASIGRYGDGEFRMTAGSPLKFQAADPALALRLREILHVKDDRFLVGIPRVWGRRDLQFYDPIKHDNWVRTMSHPKFVEQLEPDMQYYSAFITRPDAAIHIECDDYYNLCRKIWAGRKVVFFRGDEGKSFKALGRGFLSEAAELKSEVVPSVNAWSIYDQLIAKAKAYNPKKWVILMSLGPTATVLAYDLFKLGYWALDIGHLPMFWSKEHPKTPPKFMKGLAEKYQTNDAVNPNQGEVK